MVEMASSSRLPRLLCLLRKPFGGGVRGYPIYGWLGIVCLVGAEWLMFRGIEPVATFFTPIAWSAYILIVDAAVLSVTGRSRLRNAPLGLLRMAGLSIPLWMIFEGYNLRLRNWNLRWRSGFLVWWIDWLCVVVCHDYSCHI